MDYQSINEAVARLSLLATGDVPANTTLSELCDLAAEVLDVAGVGVMLTDADRNHYVHATTVPAAAMERTQESLRSGPCRDAATTGQTVTAVGLSQIDRWAGFAGLADRVGIGAIAAVPLMSRGRCWGVLDLYRAEPVAWDDDELAVAQLLANVATSHIVMAFDRDSARLAQAQLAHVSSHDHLTGLPNRSSLLERLTLALDTAPGRGAAVGVLFADLDEFKSINDTHGHRAGDVVLSETAQRLSSVLRANDVVGRLAGDEFVLICNDLPISPATEVRRILDSVAQRAREAIAVPIRFGAEELLVDVTFGAAVSSGGAAAEDLVNEADVAMYQSKRRRGGHRLIVRRTDIGGRPPHRAAQLEGLNNALDSDELEVHYQPIVDATQVDRLVAVEALVRWRTPDGGVLPARTFVETAAHRGLLPRMGAWVIGQVCEQVGRWNAERPDRAPETVFVNLSACEVNDPCLPDVLMSACGRYGISPGQIGLEIVEHDFIHPGVVDRLGELRARGHRLAIDDFGTGYSSISRLFELEVDLAKIDRTSVLGLPDDPRRASFVEAVVSITRALGMEIVAEGVETPAQQAFLADAGCTYLQGYRFGAPQTAADLEPRLH